MLKYNRDKDEFNLEFSGNLLEIVSELAYLVKKVYAVLEKKNPELAKEFQHLVMMYFGDENSLVWMDRKRAAENLIERLRKQFGIDK